MPRASKFDYRIAGGGPDGRNGRTTIDPCHGPWRVWSPVRGAISWPLYGDDCSNGTTESPAIIRKTGHAR